MAVLNREEFFNRVSERVDGDSSDEAIRFVEDMTDTYEDLEAKATGGANAEWERRYNELDRAWKERYKARFFNEKSSGYRRTETTEMDENGDIKETILIEDLFTDKKEESEEE